MVKLGVFGIGNTLMGDDGVGMVLLKRLENKTFPEEVELLHHGVRGLGIVHKFTEFQTAVIIDAVEFGGKPGESRAFEPHQAKDMKVGKAESLHQCNILEAIELSKALGGAPDTIKIYGIQPENTGFGEGLSQSLNARLEEMTDDVTTLILETHREMMEKM